MEKNEQIDEFSKKLDELIDYFAKEFTTITYAELVGVMVIKIARLIIKSNEK